MEARSHSERDGGGVRPRADPGLLRPTSQPAGWARRARPPELCSRPLHLGRVLHSSAGLGLTGRTGSPVVRCRSDPIGIQSCGCSRAGPIRSPRGSRGRCGLLVARGFEYFYQVLEAKVMGVSE